MTPNRFPSAGSKGLLPGGSVSEPPFCLAQVIQLFFTLVEDMTDVAFKKGGELDLVADHKGFNELSPVASGSNLMLRHDLMFAKSSEKYFIYEFECSKKCSKWRVVDLDHSQQEHE